MVGGCTGSDGDHSKWVDLKSVDVGDEIKIKIIDTDTIDEPVLVDKGKIRNKPE